MAEESDGDGDLKMEPVDNWVKSLNNRKVALEKEEREQAGSEPTIFRVDPSLRELKQNHFDSRLVNLGLVSKIERTQHVAETLKSDVAIKFLGDVGKSPDDWRQISESVVLDPGAIKRLYNEYCYLPVDAIRSILAEDAVFLACYLIHFFRSLPPSMLRKTRNFFSRQSRRLRLVVFKDICKLENQIPLALIKNVIVIVFRCERSDFLEKECQDKASETLEKICSQFVFTLSFKFPSFRFPNIQGAFTKANSKQTQTDSTKIAAEKTLETDGQPRGINARSIGLMLKQFRFRKTQSGHSNSYSQLSTTDLATLQLHRCQHLLHCLAEVLWNEAKISDSKNQSRRQSLWDQHLPTAKELHRYGVQFQGHKGFHPKLVRDRFLPWRATLFIPIVGAIDDDTEEIWRNLLAFEDAYMKQDDRRSFMSYVQFMNDLISTEEDVRLLFRGKNPVIIASDLGDHKAVADMYNAVSKNHFRACNAEWSSIRREVTKLYESNFKNGCMLLRSDFRKP